MYAQSSHEVRQAVYLSCMLHSFFLVMPENTLVLNTCLLIILSRQWRKLNWDAFKQAPQEAHFGTSSQTVRIIFMRFETEKTTHDAKVQSEATNII